MPGWRMQEVARASMKNRLTISASCVPSGIEHLDGGAPFDALVMCEEHLAHRAFAQLGNGLEATKPLAQHLATAT